MAYTYVVRCADGSLYTGIAHVIEDRLRDHVQKTRTCAKYTRSHAVVSLEMLFMTESYADAAKLEYRLKRLKKQEKEAFIAAPDRTVADAFPVLAAIPYLRLVPRPIEEYLKTAKE